MSTPIVIGIDGGGTKTHCLVADSAGQVLGEGLAGPSNYQAIGHEQAGRNLQTAVAQALAAAGVRLSDVRAACAGLAGVGRPEDLPVAHAMLAFLAPAPTTIVGDAHIALAGALAGEPGVVVISGTGSIALGISSSGQLFRAGGWGWLLGDEGSGFDIGRRALQGALAALDDPSITTELGHRICEAWGLARLDQAIRRIHGDLTAARPDIAALVPLVCAAADSGDAIAQTILAQAGRELGHLAHIVLGRLALPLDQPQLVAVTGGVATAATPVRLAMRSYLAEHAPRALLFDARRDPAQGAVLMALQMGGDHAG
jgi:glucosamine kinase